MAGEEWVQDEAYSPGERNRDLQEQLLSAKDALLRLRERNRHLQERVEKLERRLRQGFWLLAALLLGGISLSILVHRSQISWVRDQLDQRVEALLPVQKDFEAFRLALKAHEERMQDLIRKGESQVQQAEEKARAALKGQTPEILTSILKDALYVDPQGRIGIGTSQPQATLHVVGNLLGAARGSGGQALRIAVGQTDPKTTPWVQYTDGGIYVDVDTSEAQFSSAPFYFTSLGGHTNSWLAQGVTSVYRPTARGFRVYLSYPELTAAKAREWGWYINWVAIGS